MILVFKKLEGKLVLHQNKCHPRDVPDTRRQCAKVTDQWAQGVTSWPGFVSVWPAALCTRVSMRRGRPRRWRKSVEAEPHGQPTTWLGQPATTWQVTELTKLVTPPWTPINTPLPVEIRTHTTFGDFTCKALILSVVARRSLVGRVARL
jgi:hypothetical protein